MRLSPAATLLEVLLNPSLLRPEGPYETTGKACENCMNIHLIPHSHDDAGWLKTFDDYYEGKNNDIQDVEIRSIFNTVLEALEKDKNRKFNFCEASYFQRWWKEQPVENTEKSKRSRFRQLVKNGQVSFVGGGYVMHDEATTLFTDMIEQHTLGSEIITDAVGAEYLPKVSWQLDPFGHSAFQPELTHLLGHSAVFFARMDFLEEAVARSLHQMEFVQSASRDVLMVYLNGRYSATEDGRFDFDTKFGRGVTPVDTVGSDNIEEIVTGFASAMSKPFRLFNGASATSGDVPILMGGDFEWQNADVYFNQLDKIIHYSKIVDLSATLGTNVKFNVFYSTPEQYIQRLAESNRKFHFRPAQFDLFPYSEGDASIKLDGNATDIMPVVIKSDSRHSYWSGYYASYPHLKRLVRIASTKLRMAELLLFIFGRQTELPLREALSLAQHHDAVSGTAKRAVIDDYASKLEAGIQTTNAAVQDAAAAVLGINATDIVWSEDPPHGDQKDAFLVFNPSSEARGFVPAFSWEVSAHQGQDGSASDEQIVLPGKLVMGFYSAIQNWMQSSGVYIFRPDCAENTAQACEPTLDASLGSVSVSRRRDLEAAQGREVYEVAYVVNEIQLESARGKDVVIRYDLSELMNVEEDKPVIYTDSNGRRLIKRKFNSRPSLQLTNQTVTDPVSANFYPMTTMCVMNTTKLAVTVLTDRSIGVGVLRQGSLEFMVHRRHTVDDNRGVKESLNLMYAVKGKLFFVIDRVNGNRRSLDYSLVEHLILSPPQYFTFRNSTTASIKPPNVQSPFSLNSLPDKLMLLNIKSRNAANSEVLVRIAHKSAEPDGDQPTSDSTVHFDVNTFLSGYGNCEERTVDGGRSVKDIRRLHFAIDADSLFIPSEAAASAPNRFESGSIKTFFCLRHPTANGPTTGLMQNSRSVQMF